MGDKVRENRLRRQAARLGLMLRKSRARKIHIDDMGGYALIDAERNYDVAGSRLELDLDEVEKWLSDYEAQLRD